ncbi:MAG: hypothetical protein LBM00_10835, partial [Deltaproteobacteria bacterium]|nr:hypothetical protein [Deltaproteobacteria bacterium]
LQILASAVAAQQLTDEDSNWLHKARSFDPLSLSVSRKERLTATAPRDCREVNLLQPLLRSSLRMKTAAMLRR